MFNVKQKSDFIEYLIDKSKGKDTEKYQKQIENFFNRLEPIEQELGKDFSMCNFEEIKVVLSILCRRSVKYQKSILSQLRKYLDWCIDSKKSLDSENRLVGISTSDIDFSISYKMSMVKDEEQLSHYLDIVLRPMADDTIDNMYRALLHLIFNGFSFKEAVDLKKDQVDFENRCIKKNNKQYIISDQCCEILKHLSIMNEYVAPMFHNGIRIHEIADTGHVLERTIDSRRNMYDSMIPIISTIFNKLKNELGYQISITLNDLFTSGIFYRIYKNECSNKEIDLSEYIEKYQNQSVTINSPELIINDGMEEYLTWKRAFDL